jgi:hypothetical protein
MPVAGSYNSQEFSPFPLLSIPPATSTFPFGKSVAVSFISAMFVLPVTNHVPGSAVSLLVITVGVVAIAIFFIDLLVVGMVVIISLVTLLLIPLATQKLVPSKQMAEPWPVV